MGLEMVKVLTLDEIEKLTRRKNDTILRWERRGEFPKRLRLFGSPVWRETDVFNFYQNLKSA